MKISEQMERAKQAQRDYYIVRPLELAEKVIKEEFGESPKKPFPTYRGSWKVLEARHFFTLLLLDLGMPVGEIATWLRVDPSAVTKTRHRSLHLRRDPRFERLTIQLRNEIDANARQPRGREPNQDVDPGELGNREDRIAS